MAKLVVVHHAHHPDEGIYRLVYATETEVTHRVEVENPHYDRSAPQVDHTGITVEELFRNLLTEAHSNGNGNGHSNGNGNGNGSVEFAERAAIPEPPDHEPAGFDPSIHLPVIDEEHVVKVHSDHQEIIWADDDERWKDREPADIAAEQRQIISDTIAQRVAAVETARRASEAAQVDLGSVGQEL